MRLVVLAALVGACTASDRWDDIPKASVHAVGEHTADVGEAIRAWESVLPPRCPVPFVVADHGHRVRVLAASSWPWRFDASGVITPGGNIDVRDGDSAVVVLEHELGHALGLEHVTSRPSIMAPTGELPDAPTREDGDAAARALGCL
jgi:hypothetical protein